MKKIVRLSALLFLVLLMPVTVHAETTTDQEGSIAVQGSVGIASSKTVDDERDMETIVVKVPEKTPKVLPSSLPKTGEESLIVSYLLTLAGAILAILALLLSKKSQQKFGVISS